VSEPGARKKSVAASVRARLLNRARETQQDFNLVLTRFCLERLLYRISVSKHAEQFVLKGGPISREPTTASLRRMRLPLA
jgi:hypothetical protein